jgi:chemotaxis response regulator CheB
VKRAPTKRKLEPGRSRKVAARRTVRAPRAPFPIVGIGASAGGLEAFTQLLSALSPDTGMAFVLVQHLDPSQPSAPAASVPPA